MLIPPPSRPSLSGTYEADVCILGGGVTGCAAALDLARRGHRVVVLEAGVVGSGASGSTLGHVATGLRGPYTAAIRDFGREGAREIWSTHRDDHALLKEAVFALGASCAYEARGGFQVALDRSEGQALAESEDLLREDGFAGEFLDHYMLETRFTVDGFAGAYWSADDAEIDGLAFVQGLARTAERAGAVVFEASAAVAIEVTPSGVEIPTVHGRVRAESALVALNAFAGPLAPYLAERIRPRRGQWVAFAADGGVAVPSPAYAGHGRAYWRQTKEQLRVGGFDDLALDDESTSELGTTPLIQEAIAAFARRHLGIGNRPPLARGSGITGISRDGFPLVGRIPDTPLYCAAGFTGLGFGYTMLAARWVSEAIAAGRDLTPERFRAARPFSPRGWPPGARFAEGEEP